MYESYFNLHRRPFSTTPDPSCVCRSESVQTVLDELVVCLERGEGIAVLTAPAGLGKTLLCEKVKQELGEEFVTILLRHADFRTSADLLRMLLIEQGKRPATDSEQELRLELLGHLTELRRLGKSLIVICDEAHQLSETVLEELRRLVDHADHGISWARVMLAGQLELEEKLASPELAALNQRLRSHSTLSPLTMQESLDYIDYRITWAGGRTEEIFHPDALTAIVEAADGNPRCLNHLCDHVLLLAYVAEQRPAPAELVQEALADLQHLPLTWNVRASRSPAERETTTRHEVAVGTRSEVEFGTHLAAWESTPAFEPGDARRGFASSSPGEGSSASDPFERLLEAVESELEKVEAQVQGSEDPTNSLHEEPVVDRYAAIDAGWPVEDLPTPEPEPQAAPIDPEERLHADVLELAATTRDALHATRIDTPAMEVVETPPPPTTLSSDRPYRNLFTRLRRKQKGLD